MHIHTHSHSHSHIHTHTHLRLCLYEDAGIELDDVLHEHGLDVRRKGYHLGVEEAVQRRSRVGQVLRELANNPGSCVENLTDTMVLGGASEEVSVLQNGRLNEKHKK